MMRNKSCTILCQKTWTAEESQTVAKRIQEDYSVHMYVDRNLTNIRSTCRMFYVKKVAG